VIVARGLASEGANIKFSPKMSHPGYVRLGIASVSALGLLVALSGNATSGGGNSSQALLAGVLVFAGVGGAAAVATRRRRRLNS